MTTLFIVGMRREAAIVTRAGGRAVIGRGELKRALGSATGIVSFGICGGLDPALEPGTLVIGTEIVNGSAPPLRCDPVWTERLIDALPLAGAGPLAGAEGIVATVAAKAELRWRTVALAVDAESGFGARRAHECGIPFAAVRAVCDGAETDLPPAALVGLKPDGGEDFFAVLRSVSSRPGQLRSLVALARDARAALQTLSDSAKLVAALTRA